MCRSIDPWGYNDDPLTPLAFDGSSTFVDAFAGRVAIKNERKARRHAAANKDMRRTQACDTRGRYTVQCRVYTVQYTFSRVYYKNKGPV